MVETETVGIFIDGANIYYGLKGKRIDFKHFRNWLANDRKVIKASYFNACKDDNEETKAKMQSFFNHVKSAGFKVYLKPTTKNSVTQKWKQSGIDVFLAVNSMKYFKNFSTFILVAGDYDYLPLVEEMERWNKKIEVVSFQYCMHPVYNKWNVRYMDEYIEKFASVTPSNEAV